ncbi:MAG: hypothetical protein ACOX0U_05130 [Oscillospiraceae bacterium]
MRETTFSKSLILRWVAVVLWWWCEAYLASGFHRGVSRVWIALTKDGRKKQDLCDFAAGRRFDEGVPNQPILSDGVQSVGRAGGFF